MKAFMKRLWFLDLPKKSLPKKKSPQKFHHLVKIHLYMYHQNMMNCQMTQTTWSPSRTFIIFLAQLFCKIIENMINNGKEFRWEKLVNKWIFPCILLNKLFTNYYCAFFAGNVVAITECRATSNHLFYMCQIFWRKKYNTIGTFLIQWDVTRWPCIL